MAPKKKPAAKAPPDKTTTDRLDIIERALGANGIDLSEFDPQIVLERRAAAEQARLEAIAEGDVAAEEALGKPLTDEERRDRVEKALRSHGILDAAPEAA